MKKILLALLAIFCISSEAEAQRIQQPLGRGVVAVNRNNSWLVSWRRLAQEPRNTTYNVYQNGNLVKTTSNTNFVPSSLRNGDVWTVNPVYDGTEQASAGGSFTYRTMSSFPNQFMEINFDTSTCPVDDYNATCLWTCDLDGDGEFDYVVAQTARDRTVNTDKVQAYKSDGTFLWAVDMGKNVWICSGQNDMVLAYDIDCDGKGEVMIKSSDGTRFWDKAGNTWGKYVNSKDTGDSDGDGIIDYTASGVSTIPPFYITVIDGMTGEEKTTAELKYSEVTDGSDRYGRNNRSAYMTDNYGVEYAFMGGHFAIIYADGIHPTLAMKCLDRTTDKTHHDYVFCFSYDWQNGSPSNWHHSYTWARNNKTPWPAEFHGNRVCDVDGDGIDEIIPGAFAVNPVKGMVMSAGVGHGDRFRISDINPDRPGLEEFAIQQSSLLGQLIFDVATGEHLKEWYLGSLYDVGRGECMDVDSLHKGYEIYSLESDRLYDCEGNVIASSGRPYPYEGIWWDGDLLRESLSSPGGSGFSSNAMITKYNGARLAEFSKEASWHTHAGWAVRPLYFGDMIGDWREEVILLKNPGGQNIGMVGYTTNISTPYSMYCLQEDPHYRLDCTCRGYYQSPNTGFYLGHQMPYPPLPAVMTADMRWMSGNAWNTSASAFTTFDQSSSTAFADGKSVIFDISGDNSQEISLSSTVSPSVLYLMTPVGHPYTIKGDGAIGGDGDIWKSERGDMTISADIKTTGTTHISDGILYVNGTVSGPVELLAKGTLSGDVTLAGDISFEGALNYEGCRLKTSGSEGVITFKKSLTLPGEVYFETDYSDGKIGKIVVEGDLTMKNTNYLSVNISNTIIEGEYVIAECTGAVNANTDSISVRGLENASYSLAVNEGTNSEGKTVNRIVLAMSPKRAPAQNVWWTGEESSAWDHSTENFSINGTKTTFVTGDQVVFNSHAANTTVTMDELMETSGVIFDSGEFSISGNGGLSGAGSLTVNKDATVTMNLPNNNYTGGIFMNGGIMKLPVDNHATDQTVTVGDSSTIYVTKSSGSVSLKSIVKGDGILIKDGPGQLNFTYAGTNPFGGIVVKKGKIAMGAWNTSFGKSGAPMTLAGGTVDFINVNKMTTVPNIDNAINVVEGTKNTINGGTRAKLSGSVSGKGELAVNVGGVRMDIYSDFSNFEGTLRINGSARLMQSVTNMKKLTLNLGDGASMQYYKGGSGNTLTATLQVGALADASDKSGFTTQPTFGTSGQNWEVGYNDQDASFGGILAAQSVTKMGKGTWTITGTDNTSSIKVKEGILAYRALSGTATTGTMTVYDGATLLGYGYTNSIVANKGATISGGYSMTSTGTMSSRSNIIATNATFLVKVRTNSTGSSLYNDKFSAAGNLTLTSDTLRIMPLEGVTIPAGTTLSIFTGTKPASLDNLYIDGGGYTWDTSTLTEDGKITCTGVSGISTVLADDTPVTVYSTDGILMLADVTYGQAMRLLNKGVYIINGQKVVKR